MFWRLWTNLSEARSMLLKDTRNQAWEPKLVEKNKYKKGLTISDDFGLRVRISSQGGRENRLKSYFSMFGEKLYSDSGRRLHTIRHFCKKKAA